MKKKNLRGKKEDCLYNAMHNIMVQRKMHFFCSEVVPDSGSLVGVSTRAN